MVYFSLNVSWRNRPLVARSLVCCRTCKWPGIGSLIISVRAGISVAARA